jgi:G3E family GTPase
MTIPIFLTTGFLGAGKTTLLQRIVDTYAKRRLVYLVNEFSPVDVDGSRLQLPLEQLVSVAGGSIFCRCKSGEFLEALRTIHDGMSADCPAEGVVVEASGIANPKVIERMLEECGLTDRFDLRRVLCVVDPGTLPKLLATLPAVHAQIEAADEVIVNKCECYDDAAVTAAVAQVRGIRPDITVRTASYCDLEIDLFASRTTLGLQGEFAKCVDPNFAQTTIQIDDAVDWPGAQAALDGLRPELYRVKGTVPTTAGSRQIDFSLSGWQVESTSPPSQGHSLVIIVNKSVEAKARAIGRHIANGYYPTTSTQTVS